MTSLFVSAGEASGDLALSRVLDALPGVQAFGLCGVASLGAGADMRADLRNMTAMGTTEVLPTLPRLALGYRTLIREVEKRKPRGALLVNFSEFNTRLAKRLARLAIPIVWYIAPQVWAWRKGRLRTLSPLISRMAVVLPFEEALWRSAGVAAQYVGHPALESEPLARHEAREVLGLPPVATTVALLPGSRPHEVRALLPSMLEAYEQVRRDKVSVDARIILATSLGDDIRDYVKSVCPKHLPVVHVPPHTGARSLLSAFDIALAASGTATLEAALSGAIPITLVRASPVTALAARLLVRTSHFALPNIVLDRRAFPELVQGEVAPGPIADAMGQAFLHRTHFAEQCREVRAAFGGVRDPSRRVAAMVREFLDRA